MKTKMLITLFFLGSVIGLQAQSAAKTEAMDQAKKKTAQMDKYLSLTYNQASEVARINESYYEQRSKVNNGNMEPQERKDRLKGQLVQYKNEVRDVLTPEQQVKFDAKADELTKDMGDQIDKTRDNRSGQKEMKDSQMQQEKVNPDNM